MNTESNPEEMDGSDSDAPMERWMADDEEEPVRVALADHQHISLSSRDESLLFDLIGRIDHKILQGVAVYIEVHGTAYKVLYGVYWRSIYSGIAYWGLKCEAIERGMWADGRQATDQVDIPIRHSPEGWVVEGQSLRYLLYRDQLNYA
ncbi:MAG TPA: hypothetical protein VE842_16345 [Pyrinomonadaceae bacterium]|jgi:hypothetical protein|nr:hypothetical protein [Pyrinomonadaceae bacterium]